MYSIAQKRWLHCDPCEAACDTPLVYENGWGKKLSYIIAYSCEEVQDVTWRYSNHHKEVLTRRRDIDEKELVNALLKLRENRQKSLSEHRKRYLTKRLLMELVEMMEEKYIHFLNFLVRYLYNFFNRKLRDQEQIGRSSGSLDWRLSRGEIQQSDPTEHTWVINDVDASDNIVSLRYSSALDQYEYATAKNKVLKKGWMLGIFEQEGVFRKEEKDWKMAYLARKGKGIVFSK